MSGTDDLRKWADFELECLWGELREAHGRRDFQVWTVGCGHISERIVALTEIIGPLSWRRVPIPAIADGWFVKMNEKLGITGADLPDEEGVAYATMWVQRQGESLR